MTKLKRLKIGKFRHLKPGTEIHFSDGFNILLGQNATGKTTLLDLISAVLRSDVVFFTQEEMELEYDLVVNEGKIRVKIANRPVEAPPITNLVDMMRVRKYGTLTYDVFLQTPNSVRRFFRTDKEARLIRPPRDGAHVELGDSSGEFRLPLLGQEPNEGPGGEILTYGHPSFYFVARDGSEFTQDRLSYGQKRILSFLDHLHSPPPSKPGSPSFVAPGSG